METIAVVITCVLITAFNLLLTAILNRKVENTLQRIELVDNYLGILLGDKRAAKEQLKAWKENVS